MNIENNFERYLFDKACLTNTPISGTFELLPTCNLSCQMCYIKTDGKIMQNKGGLLDYKKWVELAKKARDAGMLFLLLTGGETLMYPQFRELYTELSSMGFILEINSNGTLIDENFVNWMKDIPPRHIKISLYGASRETYEALCGDANAFDKVMHSFQLLTKAKVPVYISMTITPYNVHELNQMIQICHDFDFEFKITSYIYPPSRLDINKNSTNYRLSPYEAAKVMANIVEIQNGKQLFDTRCEEIANGNYKDMYNSIDIEQDCMHCRAGSCTFWITWKGEMIPCAMLEDNPINIIDNDFTMAWKQLGQDIKSIKLPLECSNCKAREMCYSCAATSYCETGQFDKRAPYVCEMTKHYINIMSDLYKNKEESM